MNNKQFEHMSRGEAWLDNRGGIRIGSKHEMLSYIARYANRKQVAAQVRKSRKGQECLHVLGSQCHVNFVPVFSSDGHGYNVFETYHVYFQANGAYAVDLGEHGFKSPADLIRMHARRSPRDMRKALVDSGIVSASEAEKLL